MSTKYKQTHYYSRQIGLERFAGPYVWDRNKLRDVDKSLYCLLQLMHELKLITSHGFYHATTTSTDLLNPIEGV